MLLTLTEGKPTIPLESGQANPEFISTGYGKSAQKEVRSMAKAFVLIETAVGKTREVAAALEQLEGIESVNMVTGPYDIISAIERETLADIGDLVTRKIHSARGISRTVTCLVV